MSADRARNCRRRVFDSEGSSGAWNAKGKLPEYPPGTIRNRTRGMSEHVIGYARSRASNSASESTSMPWRRQ